MLEKKLILITGRSTVQGTGISTGKDLEDYKAETTKLQINPTDLERFGLSDGAAVIVKSSHGETIAYCFSADLPEGLAFMAFGPATSQLSGGETYASGMPDTKGIEIEISLIPA